MTVDDERRVERFLFREARLADEHRLEEWLALWADDGVYWVPANEDDIDPDTHVSIIHDDRRRIGDRVFRLGQPSAHSQRPVSRMRRVLGNIEHDDDPPEGLLRASANFAIHELRNGRRSTYAGRTEYTLRPAGDDFELVLKKVLLLDNDVPVGNITFLL